MKLEDLKFETETCGRCGGTGHYSYNQISGTRCFGCEGKKVRLTKRGEAAKKFADELRETLITDVKVGERIYWGQGGRCTVTAFDEPRLIATTTNQDGKKTDHFTITVHGRKGFFANFSTDTKVRKGWTEDMVAEVMAYQENLTKAGKPRKRPLKK